MKNYYPSGKPSDHRQLITPEVPTYIRDMQFPPIKNQFVAVMAMATPNRGMIASEFHTRCVQKGEVHELICLYENEDGQVDLNDAWYLGFIEFQQGCVLAKGMQLSVNGEYVGTLVAFDMTHSPNHLNILLAHPSPKTGQQQGIQVGDQGVFVAEAKAA